VFVTTVLFLFVEVCLTTLFPNGHLDTDIQKTYKPGDNVSVSCDNGFKANSLNTTCNKSGFWDPQPTCTIVMCPAPTVDNGNYSTHNNNQQQNDHSNFTTIMEYKFNTTIYLECDDKYMYEADGPTTFTCLADGTWDQQTSTCVKIHCNNTSDVNHEAVIKIPPDLGIGEMGNISYNSVQYHLSDGAVQVECHDNRSLTWTRKPIFGNIFDYSNNSVTFCELYM